MTAELKATAPETLAKLREVEVAMLRQGEQATVPTQHVIHAGMYARTILMQQGVLLTGALIKRATLLIVTGTAAMFTGEGWARLEGYNVIPARAGRKTMFLAYTPVTITMVFPTAARTVEDAEREFTDEADALLSRHQNASAVLITED